MPAEGQGESEVPFTVCNLDLLQQCQHKRQNDAIGTLLGFLGREEEGGKSLSFISCRTRDTASHSMLSQF